VSNVRFLYDDPSGKVVQSLTPKADYSGNGITTPCKATVIYRPTLNDDLKGLTRDQALKTDIWVIYNDGQANNGADKAVKLSAVFQDCACCGAKTISGGWLTFMCHNLGADESLDPFTYVVGNPDGSGGTLGWTFQWGRPADGHQKRNSQTTNVASGTTRPGHDKFIAFNVGPMAYDWTTTAASDKTRWGDGTYNGNMSKGPNDPCPAGWKVPSNLQWRSLLDGGSTEISGTTAANGTGLANKWVLKDKGYMVGEALYLPLAGWRNNDSNGTIRNLGERGVYWSTTYYPDPGAWGNSCVLYCLTDKILKTVMGANIHGYSVRCVTEY
jgi:uncharacterized protein (TIGR02145 family)